MHVERIHHYKQEAEMVKKCSDYFIQAMINSIENHGICRALLPGNDIPVKIYSYIARNFSNQYHDRTWSSVNLFLSYENMLTADDPRTNQYAVREHLIKNIAQFNGTFNYPDTNNRDIELAATLYEQQIKSFFPKTTSLCNFDIALLGMGEKGQIAAIMPDQIRHQDTDICVQSITGDHSEFDQITLTIEAIKKSKLIMLIVKGAENQKIMKRIVDGDPSYPASMISSGDNRVICFVSD